MVAFDATPLESAHPAGVGRYTAQLLSALLGCPDAPPVALLAARPLAPSVLNGTLGQIGPMFPNRSIWMQTLLPRALARLRPRLCHFTNSIAPLATRAPYVVTIHDMTVFLCPWTQPASGLAVARSLIPRVARAAAVIVTPSESARRDIVRVLSVPPEKVRVVYSAAAPEFHPYRSEAECERVRAKYGLRGPVVLHVGTIEPRKNLARLVRAFAALRREGRHEQLVLVGRLGWRYRPLMRVLKRERQGESVRLLHYVDPADLPALYSLARAVVQPSLYEGFGFPQLEAMATGIPVLTSNRSAMAEISGDAAVLVDPESPSDLAEGLRRILDDGSLRERLRTRGLRRAADFSWSRTAAETIRIYNEAAG